MWWLVGGWVDIWLSLEKVVSSCPWAKLFFIYWSNDHPLINSECIERKQLEHQTPFSIIHLFLVDPSVLSGQLGDAIPAACPGSLGWCPPSRPSVKRVQREASRDNPNQDMSTQMWIHFKMWLYAEFLMISQTKNYQVVSVKTENHTLAPSKRQDFQTHQLCSVFSKSKSTAEISDCVSGAVETVHPNYLKD